MKRIALVVCAACVSSTAAFFACSSDEGAAASDAGTGSESAVSSSSSGSTTSGGPGDAGLSGCAAFAEATCNRAARCTPLLIDVAYGSLDVCKRGYTIQCERMESAPGVAPLPAACLGALDTGCGDDLEPVTACIGKGTLADGTPCEFDAQCASGRCQGGGTVPGCGVCKAMTDASTARTPQGGECDNERNCEKGLSCLGASTNGSGQPTPGTCEKTRALGESCVDAEDCNTGFHGDLGWMGFTVACVGGQCAAPLAEGATCAAGSASAYPCDLHEKLRCAYGQCTKRTLAKLDEPCTPSGQTPSGNCFGDLLCAGDGGSYKCQPKPAAGEPCPKDYLCQFGLTCVDGTCTIPPADRCK